MATVLNNIIMGQIVDVSIGAKPDMSGATIRTSPLADSDVQEGATVSWRSAEGMFTRQRIPTFDEAHLLSGTKVVDLGDPAITDFLDAVIVGFGVGAGYVHPSDDHGSDIVELAYARESFIVSEGD